ncbi:hypothetical protein BDV06DRAFT_217668 [Aspergillus oleicola]
MSLLLLALSLLQQYWTGIILAVFITKLTYNRYGRGLSHIPGPILASLSDTWIFIHYVRRRGITEFDLHRKYNSPLLRLGPNTISVADPKAIKTIYGWKPILNKSRLYISQYVTAADGTVLDNVSSTRDETKHSALRRPIANAYALATLIEYEPLVDSTSRIFFQQMESRFAKTGEECDLSKWLQMYAFDIIGELTFSKRFGFLEKGKDIGNMMHHTGQAMDYIGIMGQLPFLDEYIRLKGFGNILRKFRPTGPLMKFTVKQIRNHTAEVTNAKLTDFLTKFLQARKKYPELITNQRLATYANTNVSAGSDTTGIALREIIYRILISEHSQEKVVDEIRRILQNRIAKGEDVERPITWSEGWNDMPYFQAVVKESLRIHPGLGQLIPRDVPPGGIMVCDTFIPEGTVVGCNAWTVHRDRNIFGSDAEEFVPERWLPRGNEPGDVERLRKMENAFFSFGAGPRVCLGKNIALLEISKFIPEFLRRFHIALVDKKRYRIVPGWLVLQKGLDVTLRARDTGREDLGVSLH